MMHYTALIQMLTFNNSIGSYGIISKYYKYWKKAKGLMAQLSVKEYSVSFKSLLTISQMYVQSMCQEITSHLQHLRGSAHMTTWGISASWQSGIITTFSLSGKGGSLSQVQPSPHRLLKYS